MAKIKMGEIMDHLGVQLQGAMRDTLKEMRLTEISDRELFKAFQKAVKMRCGTWENVPDSSVDQGY